MMLPAEPGTLPHRPWTTMSLVNGRTRKRSAAGGWSEAEVCAEEVADPRKPMRLQRGRPCRSAGVLRGVLPLRSARADPQKEDDHCGHPHTEKIN